MATGEGADACFVCFESGGSKRCRCNTIVHDHCLVRLIDSVPSHTSACAVCKAPYAGVTVVADRRCSLVPASCCVFTSVYVGIVLVAFATCIMLFYGRYAWCALFGAMLPMSLASTWWLHHIHRLEQGTCCPLRLVVRRRHAVHAVANVTEGSLAASTDVEVVVGAMEAG